ncbi:hypothetical protein Phum_PHUM211480 [Pediculus humanus corporis]|uniref:Uncharacterized protein n=1 Tax=Pediculus humanus subsp. corporis TaxID=121224 RepID=E0VHI5_PEDHC|nr:uncharacterized protein Phum_PHUM211480 [Pediculus humanus corporis]EEB12871.1 hypothetical protein Phum_PHUM211480 [Pediculus humanus corporis]
MIIENYCQIVKENFQPSGKIEKILFDDKGTSNSNSILLGSQYSNLVLSKPCYQKLIQDYDLNTLDNPLNHLTIDGVSKIIVKGGKRDVKVPFLSVLVSSISEKQKGTLKLMDPTSVVNAVIQRDFWEEIKGDVKVNSAFALTQV